MAKIDLTPTEEMAANAARGLELRRKHGKGGTEIGVARARDISNRKNLSPETVRRMHAFFSRHEKNKAGGEDDAGYIAWMLWSGDAGRDWAKRKVEQMNKDENQRSDTYKEIAQRLGSAAKFASIDAGMMDGAGNEVVIRMADGSRATARYNRGTGKWSLEGHADVPAFAKVRDLVAHMTKQGMARPGDRAQFSNGARNRAFLSKIDAATRSKILTSIAKHYGISASEAMAEVTDADAESLLDYMTEPERSATSVLLKRHGFSRPGAKAKMGKFNSGDTVVVPYGREMVRGKIVRYDEPGMFYVVDIGKYESIKVAKEDVRKTSMSRPGAKAKMGRTSEEYAEDVQNTWAIISRWVDSLRSPLMMENYREARQIVSKLAQVFARFEKELASPVTRLSRPGAKAKMAVEAGWRVSPDAKSSGLTVTELLPKLAKGHTFYANLKSGGTVSGTLKAFSTSGVKIDKYGDVTDLRWSDIASIGAGNIGTGPYPIRASRPVAKAKMGKAADAFNYIKNSIASGKTVYVTAGSRTTKVTPQTYAKWEASGRPLFKLGGDGALLMASGSSYVRLTMGDDMMLAGITAMSRLGAKVANAVREGEKVSAADDAVSRKIRKLMDEGKPQKQAVAIALDLERRGEL